MQKILHIFDSDKKNAEIGASAHNPRIADGNYSLFDYSYVHGLFAFGAVADLELYHLAFVERFEALGRDAREVYEDLLAVLPGNESVAFLAIEPFYRTCHK